MDLVIAGGKRIAARATPRADLGIRRGRIVTVGRISRAERRRAGRTIDARGCLVLPGGVDPHVHFDLTIGPGMTTADDFGSGSRAALAGGVTTFIDYTTPEPDQTPLQAFGARRALADRASAADYNLHNVLVAWRPAWRADLAALVRRGAPSVKLFMIYRDRGWQADDGMLFEVMEHCRALGVTVCLHAENDALIETLTRRARARPGASAAELAMARPPLVEEEAAVRAITLAEATGARLHLVHLSTAGAARAVGLARSLGLPVSGETCPQYLALTRRKLSGRSGHLFGCCPVLRDACHCEGLLEALGAGWLDAVSTDHCCFTRAQKDTWDGDFTRIPYGLPGVETSLCLTWTLGPAAGKLSLARWQYLHTEGPSRLFGLHPRKGSLTPGAEADVVVWDPEARRRIRARDLQTDTDWSPYEGRWVSGLARHVLLRGREVAREGRYTGGEARGRYVPRKRARR
ncbi:MAG: amidohydrolase family protein [Deltaproteobacteria bacterium]|nr:amidohydrolase family protein [Deltaproteobacteria bacterium]